MASSEFVTKYGKLKIADLTIARFQVRKENANEGLDDLAASIEMFGLFQPIIVCKHPTDPKKWEIVAGQRRYLAHKKILKRKEIPCAIINKKISEDEGLAISAGENIHRLDMTRMDLIDLCSGLYVRYGTIKDVVTATTLPYDMVRKYIRFDGLPSDLQKKVQSKELTVDLAMKVQDAASAKTGKYVKAEAANLLKTLKTVDNDLQKKVLKTKIEHPTLSMDKVVKKAEAPSETMKVGCTLGESATKAFRKYATDMEESDNSSIVENFIEGALAQEGYLKSGSAE